MEINVIKDDKDEIEISLDNQTIAEVLRAYLNKDDKVKLAVWKKEHYSRPLIMRIETSGKTPKKALNDAISEVKKDLKKYSDEFKKAK